MSSAWEPRWTSTYIRLIMNWKSGKSFLFFLILIYILHNDERINTGRAQVKLCVYYLPYGQLEALHAPRKTLKNRGF